MSIGTLESNIQDQPNIFSHVWLKKKKSNNIILNIMKQYKWLNSILNVIGFRTIQKKILASKFN